MKFKHKQWRKLYAEEDGDFADLPWFARAAAAELLKRCDDAGRIHVGSLRDGELPAAALARVIAFRMGATRGDRRLMAQFFPMLFVEEYLVWKAPHAIVRNFIAAQRRWDDEETSPVAPSPDNEPTTTERRTDNEAVTTEPRSGNGAVTTELRTGNDGATKQELSARKHDVQNASARARAFSSVLSSVDTSRGEGDPERAASESGPPPPSASQANGAGARTTNVPLDGEALALALSAGVGGLHGVVGCDAGLLIRLREICERREWGDRQMRRVGRWLAGDDAPDWIVTKRNGSGLTFSWLMRDNGQRFVELCDLAKESFELARGAA